MNDVIDKAAKQTELEKRCYSLALALGATEAGALAFSKCENHRMHWDGARLTFISDPDSGALAIDSAYVKKFYLDPESTYRFYFAGGTNKATDNGTQQATAEEIEAARTNLTSKGRLVRKIGLEATEKLLTGKSAANTENAGDKPRDNDTGQYVPKTANPFKPESFNLTEQGRLLRANPKLYQQLRQAAERAA